jgi:uncharacterized protein
MVEFQKRFAAKSALVWTTKALVIGCAIMVVAATSVVACAYTDSALMEAVFSGNLEEVRNLLDKGADVNCRMDGGVTPLMVAAVNGNLDVVNLLLDRGADINAKTEKGNTALDFAGYKGSPEVVALLKSRGASE